MLYFAGIRLLTYTGTSTTENRFRARTHTTLRRHLRTTHLQTILLLLLPSKQIYHNPKLGNISPFTTTTRIHVRGTPPTSRFQICFTSSRSGGIRPTFPGGGVNGTVDYAATRTSVGVRADMSVPSPLRYNLTYERARGGLRRQISKCYGARLRRTFSIPKVGFSLLYPSFSFLPSPPTSM